MKNILDNIEVPIDKQLEYAKLVEADRNGRLEWWDVGIKGWTLTTHGLGFINIFNMDEYRAKPIRHERPYWNGAEFLKCIGLNSIFHKTKGVKEVYRVNDFGIEYKGGFAGWNDLLDNFTFLDGSSLGVKL